MDAKVFTSAILLVTNLVESEAVQFFQEAIDQYKNITL